MMISYILRKKNLHVEFLKLIFCDREHISIIDIKVYSILLERVQSLTNIRSKVWNI